MGRNEESKMKHPTYSDSAETTKGAMELQNPRT